MNLLGLNWQLKPVVGPMLNNGLGAGLPSNSDVATAPSGGRGEQHSLTARCSPARSFPYMEDVEIDRKTQREKGL